MVAVADVEGDYRVPQLRDVLAEIASPRKELEEDAALRSGSLCGLAAFAVWQPRLSA